jgi:hypothetical protein
MGFLLVFLSEAMGLELAAQSVGQKALPKAYPKEIAVPRVPTGSLIQAIKSINKLVSS